LVKEVTKHMMRTHTCGELTDRHDGQEVTLCGWVAALREHGKFVFIVLRDRYGHTQIVASPEQCAGLSSEVVVQVSGKVRRRPEGTERPDEATGSIEIDAMKVSVLGTCETPPFEVRDHVKVSDEIRLKYRYLDLRRPVMMNRLLTRSKVAAAVRGVFAQHDFIEVETPMLVKSTPEGSRDFVVPSRLYPGRAYALPQSPQLYKQMLMVGGADRYYSLARCFRDEDPRRGRQLVHTQIDVEMSFVSEDDLFSIVEEVLVKAFAVGGVTLQVPFPRFSYDEVIRRWGIDKPDLRFGMEIVDFTDWAKGSRFKPFADAAQNGGLVRGIVAAGCGGYSRKKRDELEAFVKRYDAKGLAWIARSEGATKASFEAHADANDLSQLLSTAQAADGDLVLIVAGNAKVVARALGELRNHLARELNLIPAGETRPLWVKDFPMFEYDEDSRSWAAMHHMFTQPHAEHLPELEQDPGRVRAHLYDVVINGVELGSGSIRITDPALQKRIMDFIGYPQHKAEENFGFFLDAYKYGAPPHAGIGIGFDNLVMVILGLVDIKEVIAFPNNSSGMFPLDASPTALDAKEWGEYSLALKPSKDGTA